MASAPNDRKYLESHEWHMAAGDTVTIGITKFAVDELSDITYLKLPKIGEKVKANKPFGEIESVKATADLYTGVSGEVTAVNDVLASDPGLVNRDPFGAGWMVKVRVTDPAEMGKLLDADAYVKASGK